jgi:hypothetical protein
MIIYFYQSMHWNIDIIFLLEDFLIGSLVIKERKTRYNFVRFQCPELIPDIDIFLPVPIFKMAATIPQLFNVGNQFGTSLPTHISNCDDIGQCWIFEILWWAFWKWRPVEIFQCQESIWDIIIYPHMKSRSIWYVGR